jgi:hypothetical protein
MIDYHKELVSALKSILPTYYELNLHSGIKTPCISFQERNNYSREIGNTLGYSTIVYTIKVWGNDLEEIQKYAKQIDKSLQPIGWKRTSSQELHDTNSTMIQKIMTYEALALEVY